MGQEESRQESLINNKNWRLVQETQGGVFRSINPYCIRVLHNSFTNQYVEQYELQFTSQQDYQSYAKQIELRKEPPPFEQQAANNLNNNFRYSPFIYKIKYFLNTASEDLCSTIHKGLLYIQKVDLRLKEINDIPFSDQLYLTISTLQGFKMLYQKVGYFDICEEMIFISSRGKVRVWMNPNLANNQPYYIPKHYQTHDLHGSQSQMIVNLLNIIEDNTDRQADDSVHFREHLINKGIFDRLSFYKAIEQFSFYIQQNRLLVPDLMRSIYDLYHEDSRSLAESNAQRSEVVRIETNRDLQLSRFNDPYHSHSKSQKKHYSPNLTSLKKGDLGGSQASKKSYASYRSMGSKVSKNKHEYKNSQNYKVGESPIIPLLPISKGKGGGKKDEQSQISFRNHVPQLEIFSNQLSFGQINHNISFAPSSRRNSIRNPRKINEYQQKDNKNFAQVPLQAPFVTFNYQSGQSQTTNDKVTSVNNQRTVNTMNSMSSFSAKETQLMGSGRWKDSARISYHNAHRSYVLDSEIAQDLQRYLGFDVRKL